MPSSGFIHTVSIAAPSSDETFHANFSTRGVSALNESSGVIVNETRAVIQAIDSALIRRIDEDYVLEVGGSYYGVTDNTPHNTDPNLRNIFATRVPRP